MRTTTLSTARAILIAAAATLAAPVAFAQEPPRSIKSRIGQQGETCICNEDYTTCLCCETVLTPPGVACDLVIDGEEVTGPTSVDLDLTTDSRGRVEVKRFRVKK